MNKRELKSIFKEIKELPVDRGFLKSLREDLLNHIRLNPIVITTPQPRYFFLAYRLATVSIAAGLLIVLIGGGTVTAAQGSLPGDALYPVKLLSEEVRLVATFAPEKKAEQRLEFAKIRIEEIERVVAQTPKENVEEKIKVLAPALANFESQLEHISKETGELKEKRQSQLDRASEVGSSLETKLEEALPVYEKKLKEVQEKDHADLREKIESAIKASEELKKDTKREVKNKDKKEESRPKSDEQKDDARGEGNATPEEIRGGGREGAGGEGLEAEKVIEDKLKRARGLVDEAENILRTSKSDSKNNPKNKDSEEEVDKSQVIKSSLEDGVLDGNNPNNGNEDNGNDKSKNADGDNARGDNKELKKNENKVRKEEGRGSEERDSKELNSATSTGAGVSLSTLPHASLDEVWGNSDEARENKSEKQTEAVLKEKNGVQNQGLSDALASNNNSGNESKNETKKNENKEKQDKVSSNKSKDKKN